MIDTMRFSSPFLLAVLSTTLLAAQAQTLPQPQNQFKTRAELGLSTKLPLPAPAAAGIVKLSTYEQLMPLVLRMNNILGSYPPKLATAQERAKAFTLWEQALQQAWLIEKQDANSENTLFLLAEVYRQGHNLDVDGTAARAGETVDRCIAAYPDSVRCHFSAAYLYISLNPSTLPKAMKSLERLRLLHAPRFNSEVERGIFFAHLYAGDKEKASKQLDYVESVNPATPWLALARKAVKEGRLERVQ
ncbi:hypothetical protein SAMN05428948_2184 [Massilia sp. CF038]|nr:hypothetical protein SAMN05428948_2184 [Massilia sp. CF038]